MKIGPKYKKARRLGPEIFEKTQTQKYQLNADKKAKTMRRRRRSRSDYGNQLLAKQKVRFTYGISEKQFSGYVKKAVAQKSLKPTEALYRMLESRLDNVVYRMGLAPTRPASRQMVSHGHIDINGRRMTIPSYSVKEDDVIGIRERSTSKVLFQDLKERLDERSSPNWIFFDVSKNEGAMKGLPKLDETSEFLDFSTVIEFYSR